MKKINQLCPQCAGIYVVSQPVLDRMEMVICPLCGAQNPPQAQSVVHNSQTVHKARIFIEKADITVTYEPYQEEEVRRNTMSVKVRFTKPAKPSQLLEEIRAKFPKSNPRYPSTKYDWKAWGEKFVEVDDKNSPEAIAEIIQKHLPVFEESDSVLKKEDAVPTIIEDPAVNPPTIVDEKPITEPDPVSDNEPTGKDEPEEAENAICAGITTLINAVVGPKLGKITKDIETQGKQTLATIKKFESDFAVRQTELMAKLDQQGAANQSAMAQQLEEGKAEFLSIANEAKEAVSQNSVDIKTLKEAAGIETQARADEFKKISQSIAEIQAKQAKFEEEVKAEFAKVREEIKAGNAQSGGLLEEFQVVITDFISIFRAVDEKLTPKTSALTAKMKAIKEKAAKK